MMRAIADTHTHTLASGHAYSTILENLQAAKARHLRFMAVTDHAPAVPGAPGVLHFEALCSMVPKEIDGVYILAGCEANIVGFDGTLDMPARVLERLDIVIASMHDCAIEPLDTDAHTRAWLAVAANPDVDIMGHMGDGRFAFRHEEVIRACAQYGKVVEINAHSFDGRPGSPKNCRAIAKLCAEYGVGVVVSSDAHFAACVGGVAPSIEMLEEIAFPEDLVLNADCARFAAYMTKKTGCAYEV